MNDRVKNLLLILASICVGFVIIEVGLRVVGYDSEQERRFMRFSGPYPNMLKDSWLSLPEQTRGDAIRIRTDFVAPEKAEDESRVLFLGDSGTYGYGVAPEMNFPALYGRVIGEREPGTRVFNGAVVGFNTCDSIRLYRERLARTKPDLVVLGFFMANDINYNVLCGERLVKHPEWLRRGTGVLFERSAFFHYTRRTVFQVNARYRLWTAVRGHEGRPVYAAPFTLVDESGLHLLDYRAGEVATYLSEPFPLMEHAFEVTERELRNLKEATDARLVVVLIPTPAQVAGSFLSRNEPRVLERLRASAPNAPLDDLDIERPLRRILAICERTGIECVDATPVLRSVQWGSVFLPRDDHLSPLGHAATARALLDHAAGKN